MSLSRSMTSLLSPLRFVLDEQLVDDSLEDGFLCCKCTLLLANLQPQ